jgi:predicted regulator of Ras-like GTPase activity (Roadblock/LC7/MglB family)
MPRSRNDKLSNHLQVLLETSSGLDALALVSMDGLEIASALLQDVNRARLSAMTLAVFTLGQQIASEFERGRLEEVYLRGKHGFIIIMPLDDQAILISLAHEGARPGLVLLELRHMAGKLLVGGDGLQRVRI